MKNKALTFKDLKKAFKLLNKAKIPLTIPKPYDLRIGRYVE